MAKAKKSLSMILSFVMMTVIMLGSASAAAKVVYAKVALKAKAAATYETGKTVQFSVTAANVTKVQYKMDVLNATTKKKEAGKYGSFVAGKAVTTLKYVPKVAGAYTITVYAKATGSKKTYDSSVVVKFTAKAKPAAKKVVELAPVGDVYGFLDNPSSLSLPETIGVVYSDGTSEDIAVVWGTSADDLVSSLGEKEVTGTLKGVTGINTITVKVIIENDPQKEAINLKVKKVQDLVAAGLKTQEDIAAAEKAIAAVEAALVPVSDEMRADYEKQLEPLKAKVEEAKKAIGTVSAEAEKAVAAYEALAKGDLSTQDKIDAALKAAPTGLNATDTKALQARIDAATKLIYDAQTKLDNIAKEAAKKEAIAKAEAAIAKLPTLDKLAVTDEDAVKAARQLVMDANQKGALDSEIKGVDTLEKLEKQMIELIAEAANNSDSAVKASDVTTKMGPVAGLMSVRVNFPAGVTNVKIVAVDGKTFANPYVLTSGVFTNVIGNFTEGKSNKITLSFDKDGATKTVELNVLTAQVVAAPFTAANVEVKAGSIPGTIAIKVTFPTGVSNVKVTKVDSTTLGDPVVLADGMYKNVAGTLNAGANVITFTYEVNGDVKTVTITK